MQAVADPVFAFAADAATITIFDVIGGPAGVTSNRIAGALRAIGTKPVTVQINSPGGDVYEGTTIYNLLRAHPQPVTVQVLGIAASAASIIAMAGKTVQMARNSQIMIHNSHAIAMGDAGDFAAISEVLDMIDQSMAGVYAARSGLQAEQIRALMDSETYLTPDDAISMGFADALLAQDAAPALRAAATGAPQSKRALEEHLRSVGFAGAAATRLAAGGWAALDRKEDSGLDLTRIAACLDSGFAKITPLLPKRA